MTKITAPGVYDLPPHVYPMGHRRRRSGTN